MFHRLTASAIAVAFICSARAASAADVAAGKAKHSKKLQLTDEQIADVAPLRAFSLSGARPTANRRSPPT